MALGTTCYNGNNFITEKDKIGLTRFAFGSWDETHMCVELLVAGTLNDKAKLGFTAPDCSCYKDIPLEPQDHCGAGIKLEKKGEQCNVFCGAITISALPTCKPTGYFEASFREACEKVLGAICRHECTALAGLFDIWDYRVWPPRPVPRVNDVSLEDCVACLQDGDCSQQPIVFGTENVASLDSGPWGDPGILIPEKIPEEG